MAKVYWIVEPEPGDTDGDVMLKKPEIDYADVIHVIEHSAYEKAITALTNIRSEFRVAPKPDPAWMADQAVKALNELQIE